MLKFEEGDRVAIRGIPERCGTVSQVQGGTGSYLITWDDKVVGARGEEELMPCPGSHTDKRLGPQD
jgi:hypothetical protein